jgi:phosphate transport system substrate-binding protein
MGPRVSALAHLAAASALALFACACAADTLRIGGTGAALGTMRLLGEEFRKTHPRAEVEVLPSLGSPGGIRAVLAGAIAVAVSSRPLKSEELSAGAREQQIGLTPFVFAVAAGSKVAALTSTELVEIYAGAKTHWPDGSALRLVLRPKSGSESDLLYGISPEMKAAHLLAETRPGLLTTATDQENADALEKIPGALGVITFAQLVSEKRSLRALQVDGVAPSPEALRQGRYRVSVPLYLVTSKRSSPLARAFVDFAHSGAGAAVLTRNGYLLSHAPEAR